MTNTIQQVVAPEMLVAANFSLAVIAGFIAALIIAVTLKL